MIEEELHFVIIERNDLSNVLTEKQLAYFEILKEYS